MPPIIKKYRSYKNYNGFNYLNELNRYLAGKDLHQISHDDFVSFRPVGENFKLGWSIKGFFSPKVGMAPPFKIILLLFLIFLSLEIAFRHALLMTWFVILVKVIFRLKCFFGTSFSRKFLKALIISVGTSFFESFPSCSDFNWRLSKNAISQFPSLQSTYFYQEYWIRSAKYLT